jgi:predicted nucleic-acid-binding protein
MQLRLVAFCYEQFLYSLRKSKKTFANNGVFLAFVYLTKRSKKRLRQTCQALILDVYE